MLAQTRAGIGDLPVDRQVDQVLELGVAEPPADEPELDRGLLAALGEVAFVEGEAQLAVLEDEVVAGVVVAALACLHEWSAMSAGHPWTGSGRRVGIVCVSPSPRLRLQHNLQSCRRRARGEGG